MTGVIIPCSYCGKNTRGFYTTVKGKTACRFCLHRLPPLPWDEQLQQLVESAIAWGKATKQ